MFDPHRTYLQLYNRAVSGSWNNYEESLIPTLGSFSRYDLDQRKSFANQVLQAEEILETRCLPEERGRWAIVQGSKILFKYSKYPEDKNLPWEIR